MANFFLGQSDSEPLQPPPSFAELKFTTIGQEPQLLKRISAPTPDFQYYDRSSPSPSITAELQYPSLPVSPKPLARPSLLQSLTKPASSTDVTMHDNETAVDNHETHQQHSAGVQNAQPTKPLPAPKACLPSPSQAPTTWTSDRPSSSQQSPSMIVEGMLPSSTPSSQQTEPSSMSISSSEFVKTPIHVLKPAIVAPSVASEDRTPSVPMGEILPTREAESSYTGLRALQARLVSSLSILTPPNTTEALLLVQAANSHSTNALSTAHRSHTLAQQSLASAREAVTAAQECLVAAEQAKAHATDAVTAVERLSSGSMGPGVEGNVEWQWKSIVNQLQDDLRALAEWVSEREGEEALIRREADRLEKKNKDQESMEAALGMKDTRGLDPYIVQEMAQEVAQRASAEEARENARENRASLPRPQAAPAPSLGRDRERQISAELEADAAMRAWSTEHGHPPKHFPTPLTTADLPRAGLGVDSGCLVTSEGSGDHRLEESSQREKVEHLQTQREEDNRLRELHEKKLEIARFQVMERERIEAEDRPIRAAEDSRLELKRDAGPSRANGEVKEPQKSRAKSSAVVEDAKHALEAHKEKERALAESAKRAADRRLIEERKQRELADLKRKEAEKAAELEREAEAKELELLAEQGRRRQEVMLQKQRATAETAARINAERAREKEKNASVPPSTYPGPPASHVQSPISDHSTEYGNLVAKKTMTAGTSKEPRLLSGGVKLGPTERADHSTPDSLPPSPTLARSTALGLRVTKTKPYSEAVHPSKSRATERKSAAPTSKASADGSTNSVSTNSSLPRKPQSNASSITTPLVPSHPTPKIASEGREDFHVHRRSEDPGNICVVPPALMPPASPEAQAANLRFVRDKDKNSVLWDTYLKPDVHSGNIKREVTANERLSASKEEGNVAAAPENLIARSLITSGKWVDAEQKSFDISPPNCLSQKPYPLPPVKTKPANPQKKDEAIATSEQPPRAPPIQTASAARLPKPPQSPKAFSPAANAPSSFDSQLTKKSVNLKRPPTSLPGGTQALSNVFHDDTTLPPRTKAHHPPLPHLLMSSNIQPDTKKPAIILPETSRVNDPKQFEDQSQIAPEVYFNGGWDRPVDEEVYGSTLRNEEPLAPRNRSARDPYLPAPQSPSPTYPPIRSLPSQEGRSMRGACQSKVIPPPSRTPPLPPPPRSPILGKRRLRDDPSDGPPPRRQWQQNDERESDRDDAYLSRSVRPPPAREWRSPSLERPALQARIGVRDPAVFSIGGGESYRPRYASNSYSGPPSRNLDDSYQPARGSEYFGYATSPRTPPGERYYLGRHQVLDSRIERVPSSSRGSSRGRDNYNNATRGAIRARGGRGGSRPLNLEQRISSQKPLTLMHRLESPPRKY